MSPAQPVLRLEALSAGYGGLEVLHGVDLVVQRNEVVALLGANGAGKSTLLAASSGLLRPRRGRVWLDGAEVTGLPAERLVRLGLAHVPERRQVFATMTVLENLLLGAHHRLGREPRAAIQTDLAAMVQVFPRLGERSRQLAGTLSGGEQQMLAIARGLMSRPLVLLLDEPSLGLAPLVARDIFQAVAALPARGCAVLLVEQNARAALQVAARGYVLELGRIAAEGPTDALANDARVSAAYLGRRG
ncbi:MAG: ABC transporter ATP-binding protein [Chloroflexi bacterium]|nr:ABC transporter ATP-binding protein [Chloroflexota bacterium]